MSKADEAALPRLDLARMCLFLDYDGTLVDIAPTPEAALADEEILDLLRALDRRLDGALAVVSGRPVAAIDELLAPLRLNVAGLHGLELRLRDGSHIEVVPPPTGALDRVRAAFADFIAAHPGTRIEDKRLSVALHYRQAPAAGDAAVRLGVKLAEASGGTLRALRGKMVVELLPTGADKGRAIAALLDLPPFAGRMPVFIGDDVTDEAGFAVVNEHHGLSIRIGDATGATAALYRLPDTAALRRWFAGSLNGA